MTKKTKILWAVAVLLAVLFFAVYALRPAQPAQERIANVVDVPAVGDSVEDAIEDVLDASENEDMQEAGSAEDGDADEDGGEEEVVVNVPNSELVESTDVDEGTTGGLGDGSRYVLAENSQVLWNGEKVGGAHNGYVPVSSGSVTVLDGEVTGGEFVMNLAELKATDIDDEGLDSTLKEWFNTAEYPDGKFSIVSVNDGTVTGDLSMNGMTKRITFPSTIVVDETSVVANADFALDRTLWGIDNNVPAVSQFMDIAFQLVWLPADDA